MAHGGFATGSFAAGGPLSRREQARLLAIGRRSETGRAEALVEAILPFFDRLRFYPVPGTTPLGTADGVSLQPASAVVAALRAKAPRRSVATMREAVRVWAPLHDRAVALLLETVEGEVPHLRTDRDGRLVRRPDGNPIVEGGWPCKRFPEGWADRARGLLAEHEETRARHGLCGKPDRRKESFPRMRLALAALLDDPSSLTGRDVGLIRRRLASSVTKHGAPGSERLRRGRERQAREVAGAPHHEIARVLAARLEPLPQDEGVPDLDGRLGPLDGDEARRAGGRAGEPIPRHLVDRALRCLEAPIETLVARGIVPSAESLARLVPPMTARVRAGAIADPELRRLFEATYRAFRRRRSLLLLDLESQVRLEELPWVAALAPWVGDSEATRRAAGLALETTSRLALEAFPWTIVPNELVKELRSLAAASGEPLPLVDELAADIFMGTFSETYLRAARLAARLLRGTLYERYYGLPYERVLALDDVEKGRFGRPTSPGFAALCVELARAGRGASWSVARNGAIIEQAQVLTTHNLAAQFVGAGLGSSMRQELPELAFRCFARTCAGLALRSASRTGKLRTLKNAAYGFRQMVFFLAGLRAVAAGARFDAEGRHPGTGGLRFLGWTVERHPLLDEPGART